MTRWIMLGLTLMGFTLVFTTKSAGVLALGLLFGVVGLFGFIFSLAAARVAAGARPDASMASPEDLVALGKRSARSTSPQATARHGASPGGQPRDDLRPDRSSG